MASTSDDPGTGFTTIVLSILVISYIAITMYVFARGLSELKNLEKEFNYFGGEVTLDFGKAICVICVFYKDIGALFAAWCILMLVLLGKLIYFFCRCCSCIMKCIECLDPNTVVVTVRVEED